MTFPRICRALASSLKVRQGCQPLKSIGIHTVSRHQDSSINHDIITAVPQPGVHSACRGPLISAKKFGVLISGVLHSHLRVGVDETHRANVTRFRGSMNTTALLLVSGSLIVLIPVLLPIEEGSKYVLGVTGTVGGVAGAFGSRHIVENFLSGIYILVFRPFQIGDHIKVDVVEGKVLTINWSTTKVTNSRSVPVIVPNLVMLGQAIELRSGAVWKEWQSEIPIHLDDLDKIPPCLN
ncbi:hypothetical protein OROMI_007250 [Orobanche minor]